jgi:putative ABC transport system permease protein
MNISGIMISRDEVVEIFATLNNHKARTLLTAFGVFWGIFMLILLLASGDGLQNGVLNRFRGFDVSSVHLYTRTTKIPYKGMGDNRQINFTNEDIELIRKRFGTDIRYISSNSYLSSGNLIKRDTRKEYYDIYGVEPDMFYIKNVDLYSGRYINERDISDVRNVAVIGSEVQKNLFSDENPVGKYIEIQQTFYKVVGTFRSLREGEAANHENRFVFIPHIALQKNHNRQNLVSEFSVVTGKEVTERKIIEFLKERHSVDPQDNAVDAWNTRKEVAQFQGLFRGVRIFMWIVGIGTLLSGIVGVSNIMIINIKERTKEIGIRKAIGARAFSIIKMIVLESLFLTAVSGYIGLAIGLLLVEGVNYSLKAFHLENDFFLNPQINGFVIIAAITLLIIAGFFAAFFPARRAALIKPVEALRE